MEHLSHGNNLHRGFPPQLVEQMLRNPGQRIEGCRAECEEQNGRVQVKIWYGQYDEHGNEYYVSAC